MAETRRDIIVPLLLGVPLAVASILPATTPRGQMFAIAASCTAAVLAFAGGLELFGRTKRGWLVLASAVILGIAELAGVFVFTNGLGADSSADRRATETTARYLLVARGIGWAGVAAGLALTKSALWTTDAPARARTHAALRFVSGAMIAMLVVAVLTFTLSFVNVLRDEHDPSGAGLAIGFLAINAIGVLVYGALGVRGRGRTGMAIAASVFVFYVAISAIHLLTLSRIISGSDSHGSLGSDGRAVLPEAMPLVTPIILAIAWCVLAIALHALAASTEVDDRGARRALSSRAAQTTRGGPLM